MTAVQKEDPDDPDRYIEDALNAFAAAGDLDSLKAARLEHAGDRSPVALAMRGIAGLPPDDRSETARRLGVARSTIIDAARRRKRELESAT